MPLMVPVVGSTRLSSVEKRPWSSVWVRAESSASAGMSAPPATRFWMAGAPCCGMANSTSIGWRVVTTTMPFASPAAMLLPTSTTLRPTRGATGETTRV